MVTSTATIKRKNISHSIPNQLSSHINNEYPLFVDFLKGYYEWLECEDSPYYLIRNHMSFLNFRDSLEAYVDFMKDEYIESIPSAILASKELMIKYSKQIHQSVGTERSFKFLFKALFDEDIEISYPRDNILRTSDGKWIENEFMMLCSNTGNADNFVNRRITQEREIFPGIFEYASANVDRLIKKHVNRFNIAELYMTEVEGVFDLNHPIVVDSMKEWILPISNNNVEIINSGERYVENNILEYNGPSEWSYSVISDRAGSAFTRFSTLYDSSELNVSINGQPLLGFGYDGVNIIHPDIRIGDIIELTFPVYPGLLYVAAVDDDGRVTEVKVVDTPFGITDSSEYLGSSGGEGVVAMVNPDTTRGIPGYSLNTDGFLSADKVLQDSYFYQEYSYVIKAGISLDKYKDIVLETIHPAGMMMFGEINILEVIRLLIKEIRLDINILSLGSMILISTVPLYNRTGFIEDWKNKFDPKGTPTGNVSHVIVGDVVERPNTPLNLHDCRITVI